MTDENGVVQPNEPTEVTPEVTPEEETIEQVRQRLADETAKREKAEEIAENQRIRAEKAEKRPKETVPVKDPESKADGPSFKDALAISNAKVHEDDVDEVMDYAKLKGISVSKALESDIIKAVLADKSEKRKSAETANVSTVRRGPSKITDDTLLENASAGKLPESEEDIARLVRAKQKAG